MNNNILPFNTRLFLGTLLAMLVPMGILEPILGFYQGKEAFSVSMLLSALAHFFNFKTLYTFGNYPGRKNMVSALPHTFFWYVGSWMLAKFFNLPYSVWFFFLAGCTSFLLCAADIFYRNRFVRRYAYIPLGRATTAPQLPDVEWQPLTAPVLTGLSVHGIVADLHSPDLDAPWQQFLAAQTLQGMPVYNIRQIEELLTGRVKITHMYENDLGSLLPSPTYVLMKRLADIALIVFSCPLTLPVMLATAAAVRWESRGPVLFVQNRVGRGGREFRIYKFRSMTADAESGGARLAEQNDVRITRVGRFIRKTRIDELPQFFNILKGDMSLIGPRPEQKVFVDRFEEQIPFYDYRHIVRPGLSGWAQVMQGYAGDAEETQVKIEHDFYYIKHFSFSLDVLIFFKTLKTVLTGFGAR